MAESWSIEDKKQLQALMAKKVVTKGANKGGAVSDGSKRRYVAEKSIGSMDNPWVEVEDESHLKVDLKCVELEMPMDINSMEQWGRTYTTKARRNDDPTKNPYGSLRYETVPT